MKTARTQPAGARRYSGAEREWLAPAWNWPLSVQRVAAVNCTLVLWAGLSDIEAKPFIHLKYIYHFIMRRSFIRVIISNDNESANWRLGRGEEERWEFWGDKNERRSEKRLLVKIVRDYVKSQSKEKYRILQSEVYIKFQEGSYLNCLMFL